jgi:hypothetical protein
MIVAPLFIGACPPYRAVMEILTRRDHVDDEIPRRGRARIAGSAIAPRFGRFANCVEPAATVQAWPQIMIAPVGDFL